MLYDIYTKGYDFLPPLVLEYSPIISAIEVPFTLYDDEGFRKQVPHYSTCLLNKSNLGWRYFFTSSIRSVDKSTWFQKQYTYSVNLLSVFTTHVVSL